MILNRILIEIRKFSPSKLILLSIFLAVCNISENIAQTVNTKKISVVIIGSSIASGTGATNYSNSWAGLLQSTSQDNITNNAVPGYTTFHFLPVTKPNSLGIGTDVNRNISASLKLNPDLIIFSITTNDIADGFTMDDYLTNMKVMTDLCDVNKVPYLIGSTTPRSLDIVRKRVLTRINEKLSSIYQDRFVSYYYPLTNLDTFEIKSIYNSGDNLHPNNLGHKVMFDLIYPAYLKMKSKILLSK